MEVFPAVAQRVLAPSVGTGGIWSCNDWYFYGNGVFRSTFVGILVGSKASVQVNWLYSYINAGVQVMSCCSVKALTLKGHTTLPLQRLPARWLSLNKADVTVNLIRAVITVNFICIAVALKTCLLCSVYLLSSLLSLACLVYQCRLISASC